ncbi:hypothetical protein OMD46_22310 [Pseudomonas sp. MDMC_285]|uniref:hypothetical protein n=1 Tax=Pseudomonas sp. o96-267 TaxID=2479853 RepID=UPI000A6F023A|nr:hypothetical protein [Pseudomonas sp. o96-267]MCW1938389.1 hypothetical protein [Pseudomonas sp. MDMC_285]
MVGLGFSLWWGSSGDAAVVPAGQPMLPQSQLKAQSKQAFDFPEAEQLGIGASV